ncbi:MAG: GNAT family N-acetyltransferase [Pseudomonadota bacterium]
MAQQVLIRPYRDEDQAAFKALNLAWITQHFSVEPFDLSQLDHPNREIITTGGAIFVAQLSDQTVGTIGLVPHGPPDRMELIKMAVSADQQGRGIGRKLLQAAKTHARQCGVRTLWLETNTKLGAALRLYRASGFRDVPSEEFEATPYARCDVQMICDL